MTLEYDALEKRLDNIQTDIHYLRDQIDHLKDQLNGVIWKVVGIGAGSGAVGFVIALLTSKVV